MTPAPEKIVSLDDAIAQREAWRAEGKTVAFTNGCYDLLHAGHVTSIAFAREQGDVLILAVNDDESVAANKGPLRPIIPVDERALLLASLQTVDLLVTFGTKEVIPVVEALRPDVLVKGGDTAKVLGQEFIESYGGKVVRTPIFKDLSTTDAIARICERYP